MSASARIALKVLGSLLIAGGLLAILFSVGGLDLVELRATLGRLSWPVYAAALGAHLVLYALRAARFRVLLPPEHRPGFGPLLAVNAAYSLAALVLPAKVGEGSFVLYSNKVCGTPMPEGLAALAVARVLDLALLLIGFGVACVLMKSIGAYPALGWLLPLGLALLALACGLFVLAARGDLLVRLGLWLLRALHLDRTAFGVKLVSPIERLSCALLRASAEGRLLTAALLTIPQWIAIFAFCVVLAYGFGISRTVGIDEIVFGSSFAMVTTLIPVSAFANFGTLEAGWVLGFGVVGVGRELATATGVGLHLVQLLNAVLLGGLGHVGMALSARTTRKE